MTKRVEVTIYRQLIHNKKLPKILLITLALLLPLRGQAKSDPSDPTLAPSVITVNSENDGALLTPVANYTCASAKIPLVGSNQVIPDPSTCTLRAAIMLANSIPTAARKVITIKLPEGIDPTLTLGPDSAFDLETGDLDITRSIVLEGAGGNIIDAKGLDRAFSITGTPLSGIEVVFSNVTIQGGNAQAQGSTALVGGGIYHSNPLGSLTLNQVTMTGNKAKSGGGIYNQSGKIILNGTTIGPHNQATATFNAKVFEGGAGIFNDFTGIVIATNSTISTNTSAAFAGGILNKGLAHLVSTTLVKNISPASGSGLFNYFGAEGVRLKNSIIAKNLTSFLGFSTESDCYSITGLTSSGGNFIGQIEKDKQTQAEKCAIAKAPSDIVGVAPNAYDPLLDDLKLNGGKTPVKTHQPKANSPVLNKLPPQQCRDLSNASITIDQRGLKRPSAPENQCDVGAVDVGCGNGRKELSEACDDGNLSNGDGCSNVCVIEVGYSCKGDEPSVCETICGDGVIAGGEKCDDQNAVDGDCCSSSCSIEPGCACSGMSEPSECSYTCGDSLLHEKTEECDLGDQNNVGPCTEKCTINVCGDGYRLEQEQCDDKNKASGDGCSNSCMIEPGYTCSDETGMKSECQSICGDGLIKTPEVCDDKNTASGDGCNSTCSDVEDGYSCEGEPSTCTKDCGDGVCDPQKETAATCSEDCQAAPVCNNNNACESGENALNCANDCAKCGDGICTSSKETAANCPTDCSNNGGVGEGLCGNGEVDYSNGEICDDGNTVTEKSCDYGTISCTVCSGDCKSTSIAHGPYCGDKVCQTNQGETTATCSSDCKSGNPICGNNICEAGETASSCAQDCVTPPTGVSDDELPEEDDSGIVQDRLKGYYLQGGGGGGCSLIREQR